MTFWAKLLTVILLVLSLAFAAMSGVIFSKRENFRGKFTQSDLALKDEKESHQKAIEDFQLKLQTKSEEIGKKTTEIASLKKENETIERARVRAESDLKDARAEVIKFQDTLDKYSASLQTYEAHNKELKKTNQKVETENRGLMADLTKANTRISNLEKLKSDLENERDKLKTNLAKASEDLRFNEEIFKALAEANIEAKRIIAQLNALPRVEGKVVYFDPATKTSVLNVGRKHGVKKNFAFTIYRGGQFMGKINIFEVDETQCAGFVELSMKGRPIQQGDNATTRLP